MFKVKIRRILLALARKIVKIREKKPTFWVLTVKYVQSNSTVKYVRWYEKSKDVYFPFSSFVIRFRMKFNAMPTVVSSLEISEGEYNKLTNKIKKESNE